MKHPLATIAGVVYDVFGVEEARLRGPLRMRRFVRARQAFMLLAMREGYSLPRIGRYLGNRHHTTVLHGCQRAREFALKHRAYADMIDAAHHKLDAMREPA